jgi:hypothetical protein
VKVDVLKINGPAGLLVDWKTGKVVEDSVQLVLAAAVAFYNYPELQVIRSMYVWLKENAETKADIKRSELPKIWGDLWPRIQTIREAHEASSYPPSPSYLCERWCPVKTCPNHGMSFRR